MNFLNALNISGSGLTAQKLRMDIMSQNIANSETTRTQSGGTYRRQLTVLRSIDEGEFKRELTRAGGGKISSGRIGGRDMTANSGGVMVDRIIEDRSDFIPVYDPTHPDSDEEGYVMMPNVNRTQEMIDMLAATRAYSANVTMFNATKSIISNALQIGR